jgi:ribulose-5-phosphate 4-epimerase/fuculose-1-phosphate aldolase
VTFSANEPLKAQVAETAQKAARLGLMPSTHGNFSARPGERPRLRHA